VSDDLDTSPFPMPTLACRECGRTDEHTYCHPWLAALTALVVLLIGGCCIAMFVIGAFYG
jgi:hypothetical protein